MAAPAAHPIQVGRPAVEAALGSATRILPIITTAHLPSAAHDTYSPEFYTNQSIADPASAAAVRRYAGPEDVRQRQPARPPAVLADRRVRRPAPGSRAQRQVLASRSRAVDRGSRRGGGRESRRGRAPAAGPADPEFRRAAMDIRTQIGIGRFFAAKFRSGALYAVFKQSGDRAGTRGGVEAVPAGEGPLVAVCRSGEDRLCGRHHLRPAAAPARSLVRPASGDGCRYRSHGADAHSRHAGHSLRPEQARAAIDEGARASATSRTGVPPYPAGQTSFAGSTLELALTVQKPASPSSVRVHYRHVNQAERYQTDEMRRQSGRYRATIPAAYTDGRFPLQYYFELRQGVGQGVAVSRVHARPGKRAVLRRAAGTPERAGAGPFRTS